MAETQLNTPTAEQRIARTPITPLRSRMGFPRIGPLEKLASPPLFLIIVRTRIIVKAAFYIHKIDVHAFRVGRNHLRDRFRRFLLADKSHKTQVSITLSPSLIFLSSHYSTQVHPLHWIPSPIDTYLINALVI